MGFLELTHGHRMYYEQHGSPTGKPVVVLHGGPGGGITHKHLSVFDLTKWRVILFDQRGCGKSTPFGLASLRYNKTKYLVEDIERLRQHLGITAWYVFGGSWGTTLGILYAETYPSRVTGLLLRSVCLLAPCEFTWFFGGAAGLLYPAEWADFVSVIDGPVNSRSVISGYRKLLTSADVTVRQRAAKRWSDWEHAVSYLRPHKSVETVEEAEAVAVIENHYFYHNCWLQPNQLLKDAHRLANIPVTVVHGRYDVVCPIKASFDFKKAVPHAKFIIVPDAGHATTEPGTRRALASSLRSVKTQRGTVKAVRRKRDL